MKHFLVLFLAIPLPRYSLAEYNSSTSASTSFISNHNFLFISGWPQSGTSLMQQMFTVAPDTSTMVEKCKVLIPGNKCLDWNFEGQWALKFLTLDEYGEISPSTALLNPGTMCESTFPRPQSKYASKVSFDDQRLILNEQVEKGLDVTKSPYWSKHWDAVFNISTTFSTLWDLDLPLMVEKSPHNMLKMHLLRDVFAGAKSIKFLVTIKHPATLNVALPRDYEWLTKKIRTIANITNKNGTLMSARRQITVPLNSTEIQDNARFFLKFLKQKMKGTGRSCTVGWMTAMERLSSQLKQGLETPRPFKAKIVRYENFVTPVPECNSIFKFVHSDDLVKINNTQTLVCKKYFTPGPPKNKTSKIKNAKNNTKKSTPRNSTKKSSNKNNTKKSNKNSTKKPNKNSTKNNRKNDLTNIKRQLNENHGVYEEIELKTKREDNSHDIEDDREYNDNSELSDDDESDLDRGENRRKLRLRWQKAGKDTLVNELEFLPDLHRYSIETRLAQYHKAYAQLPDDLKEELDIANEELKKYGYSLQIGEEKWYLNHTSVFDMWTQEH